MSASSVNSLSFYICLWENFVTIIMATITGTTVVVRDLS